MKHPFGLALALLVAVAGCTTVNVPSPGTASASEKIVAAKEDTTTKDAFKPWDAALKDTRPIEGFLTFHLKRDRTLYLELRPDQLAQDFGLVMHLNRGIADLGLTGGIPTPSTWSFDTQIMQFHRVGDQIHLQHRNARFAADADSPMAAALEKSIGHSIAGVFKIESEHKETGGISPHAGPLLQQGSRQL